MTYDLRNSPQGPIALIQFAQGESLDTVQAFFEALMEAPAPTVCVEAGRIAPAFFELRSGFAGEVLQKVSNYRRRLILLGDFASVASKSLRDFIFESNRTGQVVFAEDLEAAIGLLK